MKHFLTLKDFFLQNKFMYLFGVFWLIFTNMLQTAIPKVIGSTIDAIALAESLTLIHRYLFAIAAIALLIAASRYLWRIYLVGVARKLEYYLRNRIFSHMQILDARFYDGQKTGDLMALASNDVTAVRMAFAGGVVMVCDAVVITGFAIAVMAVTIDPLLTLLALLPLPVIALVVTRFNQVIHERFKRVQAAFAKLTDKVQENISAIRVVKSFVLEDKQIDAFNETSQGIIKANMHLVKVSGFLYPLVQLLASFSFLVVLGYGGFLVLQERITLGDFVAFNGYLMILTWPMMAIGYVINILQRGTASMSRINDLLNRQPEIFDDPDVLTDLDSEGIRGPVRFEGLDFCYPQTSERVLKDFSMTIQPGETIAVFGRTGSGKSTITDLLLRLYEVEKGKIYVNELEIHRIPLRVLRGAIGYVPQDSFLFSMTIGENIAFSRTDADMDEIVDVAKAASIYEDIMSFPQGFDTMVGERGITLSGGQKQRVAIARALLRKPEFLILDDSLSAVDTATEELILAFLTQYRKSRSTIIISHRISAVKDADKIIVLDQGEVVQQGTHEQLIKNQRGLYYRMVEMQRLEEERLD